MHIDPRWSNYRGIITTDDKDLILEFEEEVKIYIKILKTAILENLLDKWEYIVYLYREICNNRLHKITTFSPDTMGDLMYDSYLELKKRMQISLLEEDKMYYTQFNIVSNILKGMLLRVRKIKPLENTNKNYKPRLKLVRRERRKIISRKEEDEYYSDDDFE